MHNRIPDSVWPLLTMAVVFFVSGQTEVAAPDVSFSIDKVAHFVVYGVIATSILRIPWFLNRAWQGALLAALIAMIYGGLDEFRQSFTPGRVVEIADWIADALGAVTAVILYQGCSPYRKALEWSWKSSA